MQGRRVVELYAGLEAAGAPVWLDGGWGVDALLKHETRAHSDLDVVVRQEQLSALTTFLAGEGFAPHPLPPPRAWNFVLANVAGELVDVHVVQIAEDGRGVYGPPADGVAYPADALLGSGEIEGVAVRCLSAEYQLESHTGYVPRAKDIADVRRLAKAFGLQEPEAYQMLSS